MAIGHGGQGLGEHGKQAMRPHRPAAAARACTCRSTVSPAGLTFVFADSGDTIAVIAEITELILRRR